MTPSPSAFGLRLYRPTGLPSERVLLSLLHKEAHMSDDKAKIGHDRKLINLNEPYEVRDWTQSLGVSEGELRRAVAAVGNSADKVREHLKSSNK